MNNKDLENYDVIIDVTSIGSLKKNNRSGGWNIIYTGNEDKKKKIKNSLETEEKGIVAILGHSNRGKTYILQKICEKELHAGYQIQTKGLSMKLLEDLELLLIDNAGTNVPLLVENVDNDPRQKQDFPKYLDNICLYQIITNYIIQTFVINHADTLIGVVGQLTSTEQQLLIKLKKFCRNKKLLIIIHNLINCYNKNDIEQYIEETLKKVVKNKLEPISFIDLNNKEDNDKYFNRYFIEQNDKDDIEYQFDILHFILANDRADSSKDIQFYNKTTIEFIKDYISNQTNRTKNIIKKFREHILSVSRIALEEELKSIVESNDMDLIYCKEDIKCKNINADELDNITFIGKEYMPLYRYYIKNNKFIIEIEICSKLKEKSLKADLKYDSNAGESTFFINGEIETQIKKEQRKYVHTLVNKRKNIKVFKLTIKIKNSEFGIVFINKKYEFQVKNGLLFLIYNYN